MPIKVIVILISTLIIGVGGYFGFDFYKNSISSELSIKNNEETNKLKSELDTKNSEIKTLTSKVEALEKELINNKAQISSKDIEIQNLKKNLSSKESDLDKLDSKLTKQEYCNKMNEYSQLSSDLKFRTSGESGGNGCSTGYASHISSNTENAYEYIEEWYKNYKNTGSQVYKHSPDVCLYDVEKLRSKLKERRDKYREYKEKCN